MDTNIPIDEPIQESDAQEPAHFTKHSAPVSPTSPEDEIRTAAEFVVQSVPLPGLEEDGSEISSSSPTYGTAAAPPNIDELTAEDIREDY